MLIEIANVAIYKVVMHGERVLRSLQNTHVQYVTVTIFMYVRLSKSLISLSEHLHAVVSCRAGMLIIMSTITLALHIRMRVIMSNFSGNLM